MTENKGRQDGGQKSGHHVQQELHHRHHLLSEDCPTAVLPEKAAAFKKTPRPYAGRGIFLCRRASSCCASSRASASRAASGVSHPLTAAGSPGILEPVI